MKTKNLIPVSPGGWGRGRGGSELSTLKPLPVKVIAVAKTRLSPHLLSPLMAPSDLSPPGLQPPGGRATFETATSHQDHGGPSQPLRGAKHLERTAL